MRVHEIPEVTIIVDALDECQEPKIMIKHFNELSRTNRINVIFTSRREAHLVKRLGDCLSFEICRQDVNGDIGAFIEAKVSKSIQLSNPLLRETVVAKLSEAHEGMFLWVFLMLKELKYCTSLSRVQKTLMDLPKGLDMVYCRILQRLDEDLHRGSRDVCQKVLGWVVTALRPLRIEELRDALVAHYQYETGNMVARDEILMYSEREIALVCGSLVTVQNRTVQLIHLSTKEFLQRPLHLRDMAERYMYLELLVDPHLTSLQLTMSCLGYVSLTCNKPITDMNDWMPQFYPREPRDEQLRLESRLRDFPLAEYAIFSWLVHLVDCDILAFQEIVTAVRNTYDSPCTFCWIEMCLALDGDSLWRVVISLQEIGDWISDATSSSSSSGSPSIELGENGRFVESWCKALLCFFTEYGGPVRLCPSQVHSLDLSRVFQADALHGLYDRHADHHRRDLHVQLCGYVNPFARMAVPKKLPPVRKLQQNVQSPSSQLGFPFMINAVMFSSTQNHMSKVAARDCLSKKELRGDCYRRQ